MAHIFDVMSTINGHLNNISRYYDGITTSIRSLSNIPNFLMTSVNRTISYYDDIIIDDSKVISIDLAMIADTGDKFNPVYICVASNIKAPAVDKVPIMVNYKSESGPGVGYMVLVPRTIFGKEAYLDDIGSVLKDLYFQVLNFDSNMEYEAGPDIIRLADSQKIKIDSYDLAMSYVALCFANINLKAWSNNDPNSANYILDSFTEEQIPKYLRSKLYKIMTSYGSLVGNLRDSIETGNLLINIRTDDYSEEEEKEATESEATKEE